MQNCPSPYWLQFVQPFGTVFLGVAAFLIAFNQWRTANEKLKLDLFDRRFQILDSVLSGLNDIIRHGETHRVTLGSLMYDLKRLRTVFGEDIERILVELEENVSVLLSETVKSPEVEGQRDSEWLLALNNVTRLGPELQQNALMEMKINVPNFLRIARGKKR